MISKACHAAVLVPLYKESLTDTEEFSLKNTLSILSRHDLYVICPQRLGNYIEAQKKEKQLNFGIEFFPDRFFSNIQGYNYLLKSIKFYKRFDRYDYILIVQTDALVFADKLEEWCDQGYSYIGAPWLKGLRRPSRPLTFLGVGNGGFSLRKVSDFLRVLSSPQYHPPLNGKVSIRLPEWRLLIGFVRTFLDFSFSFPPIQIIINEDIFWGILAPARCKLFTVPRPEDAIPFAFEAAPEYLFELNKYNLPFGCHGWGRYNPAFWSNTLKKIGIGLP